MKELQRWKRAVVHLEGATSSVDTEERIRLLCQDNAEVDRATLLGRDVRERGTALFCSKGERRYLITARHVLDDKRKTAAVKKRHQESEARAGRSLDSRDENIVELILVVPSLDHVLRSEEAWPDPTTQPLPILMGLGSGGGWLGAFSFSSEEMDLAIISLDRFGDPFMAGFADGLQRLGYVPIGWESFADGPSGEGAEIFTVGFPQSTAVVGQISLILGLELWAAGDFSLPTFAFGRVASLHEALSSFWADLAVYPGGSGGPVVEEDRLVGIAVSQPRLTPETTQPLEGAELLLYRIPFARAVKSRELSSLLATQELKDSDWEKRRRAAQPPNAVDR